jgi:hypothetical protein
MKRNGYTAVLLVLLLVVSVPAISTAVTPAQEQPDASFDVSSLTAPENVSQGETLEVEATVTNNGSSQGQAQVEYRFNESVRAVESVSLEAGENDTVAFEFTVNGVEAGNYTHGVFTDSDNATAEIEVDERDGPERGPPEDVAAFQDTSPLDANKTDPSSLAGQLRVESDLKENTSVTLTTNSSTEYSLNITVTEEAENVTFFLQSKAVESSQDIENITAYLDGEEMEFYVDESAGPGNSPWILFEVDHFSTRTVTFASGSSGPVVTDGNPAGDLDRDGLYEDVNGDGAFTIGDVRALFTNRASDSVQDNTALFDFDDDGAVTIGDVRALFLLFAQN